MQTTLIAFVSIYYNLPNITRSATSFKNSTFLIHFIAIVSDVSATPLNSTSVRVSWTPVNLAVVYHYTVHYTTVGGVSGTVTFPDTFSSGVVSVLQGGQQYQFSVTVTVNIGGELYTGLPDNTLPPITCM